jgi:hypothetical protein
MKRICFNALACLLLSTGMAPAAMTFEDYEALYREQGDKLTAQCEKSLGQLLEKYRQNLVNVRDSWQRAGDLDGVVSVNEELKRFDENRTVPAKSEDGLPPVIRKMQSDYHTVRNRLTEKRDRMIVGLTEQYVSRLDKLKKQNVIAGNIDEAARINDEIKRTEFILADASSRLPVPGAGPSDTSGGRRAARTVKKLPAGLDKGLVLCFDFDESRGSTVRDNSPGNNDGVVRGAKWVKADKDNGAYQFDGEDDYVEVPNSDSLALPRTMTISMWIKLEAWQHGGGLCTKGTGGGGESWGLDMYGAGIRFYRWHSEHKGVLTVATPPASKGRWHHVVGMSDGKVLRVSLDANESVGPSYSKPFLVNDHIVSIGSRQSGSGPYDFNVKGLIDDVMIWNRALSKDEIARLRAATKHE